ncbi:hypothetical protein CALCODRAFT_509217 [Calocera cornea HHB12733]|uniref:Uncharacterized protein n=1 Tax=Calocera cornea HHB12733 TaxID=1353952 RepID=A0A165FL98_9BASI|nr:hypothetical protein CALCODRAFT_509217 [Calocera cornea HHB12733]
MELDWLAEICSICDEHLDDLTGEAQDKHDEIHADKLTIQQNINKNLAVVHVKRNKHMMEDHWRGIPLFNALTMALLHKLLQDLDGNIETICCIVDQPQPSLALLNGMAGNLFMETLHKSAESKAKIRNYIAIKHSSYLMKHNLNVLKWSNTLLENDLALWSQPNAGLLTPCGSLHLDNSSGSSRVATEESSKQ